MTALGSATLVSAPAPKVITTDLTPAAGGLLGSAVLVSGGTPVAPKRYVNISGTATPIQ